MKKKYETCNNMSHTKRYSSYAEPTHSSRVNEGIPSFRVEERDGEVLGELWLGVIQDGEGERHGGLPALKCQLLIHREIVSTCSSTRSWGGRGREEGRGSEGEGRGGGGRRRKEGEEGGGGEGEE